jgi:subtilisin family serine protease
MFKMGFAVTAAVFGFYSKASTPIFYQPIKPDHTINAMGATPFFENKQFYLEAAPRGVGAREAWKLPGGDGANVRIVDVEVCFETGHEDFTPPYYIGSNPACSSTDHGTAVWGVVAGKADDKGITGIAHGAQMGVYGFIEGDLDDVNDQYIKGINTAIRSAAAQLQPGDVMIIEQHMTGPDNFAPVEYWKEIFDELKAATDRGIICVEAAGNGGSNLDGKVYAGAFDLKVRDSGCIMVGASNPNRGWIFFSNYGSRIDAYGYGDSVTTTGYGDLFRAGKTRMYTSQFNGTSSATPVVSGAIAVVSSIAKAKGRILTPAEIRAALRATGTPQDPSTADKRIGNLPDISAMLKYLSL